MSTARFVREVARRTGESPARIRRIGFQPLVIRRRRKRHVRFFSTPVDDRHDRPRNVKC